MKVVMRVVEIHCSKRGGRGERGAGKVRKEKGAGRMETLRGLRGLRVSTLVGLGEGADCVAHRGEAVAPGGREVAGQVECRERIDFGGGDFGGGRAGEKIAKKDDETANEWRLGVTSHMAVTVVQLTHQPDHRDTAVHTVGFGALGGEQRRDFSGAIDDRGEPLVRIVEHREIVVQALQSLVQDHAGSVRTGTEAASPRAALQRGGQRAVRGSRRQP